MVMRFPLFLSGVFGSDEPVNLLQSLVEIDPHGETVQLHNTPQLHNNLVDDIDEMLGLLQGDDLANELKAELNDVTADYTAFKAECNVKVARANQVVLRYNMLKQRFEMMKDKYNDEFGLNQISNQIFDLDKTVEESLMQQREIVNTTVDGEEAVPVAQGDGCPTGTHPWRKSTCCCGSACCWERCTWSKPPTENCLVGQAEDATWKWSHTKGYYQAIPTVKADDVPVAQGNGCPAPTHPWQKSTCCCGSACCWERCTWSTPPTENCLVGQAKGATWKWSKTKGYYQAISVGPSVDELRTQLADRKAAYDTLKAECNDKIAQGDEVTSEYTDLKVRYMELVKDFKAKATARKAGR